MSVSPILTGGMGSFGSVNLLPTLGFADQAVTPLQPSSPDYWELDYADDWLIAADDDADFAGDWEVIDDMLTVTLYSRTSTTAQPTTGGVQVQYAFKTASDRDEMTEFGQLATAGCAFHLWTAKLGGSIPKVNDVIEEADGVRWMIERVKNCDRGVGGVQRYRCECSQERT